MASICSRVDCYSRSHPAFTTSSFQNEMIRKLLFARKFSPSLSLAPLSPSVRLRCSNLPPADFSKSDFYSHWNSNSRFGFRTKALGNENVVDVISSENTNPSETNNSRQPKRTLFFLLRAYLKFLSKAMFRFFASFVLKYKKIVKSNKSAIVFASFSLFTLTTYAAIIRFPSPSPPTYIPYSQLITQVALHNVQTASFEEGSNRLHFNLKKIPSDNNQEQNTSSTQPDDSIVNISSSPSSLSSSINDKSSVSSGTSLTRTNAIAYASKFLIGLKANVRVGPNQSQTKAEWDYTTRFVKGDESFLLGKLREEDIPFSSSPVPVSSLLRSTALTILLVWLPLAPFLYLMLRQFNGKDLKRKRKRQSSLVTRFDDVAGVDQAKAELMEVVQYMKGEGTNPSIRKRIPRGILLVGPPGTGKTLLARAVAGEAGLPFFSVSASEFVEMFVGRGAARIRELFSLARRASPSVLFIDELDAVGGRRGGSGFNDEREQTLNQLLTEMDGFDTDGEILVIAATNRVDVLDPALIRSGRISRQVHVGLPDVKGRSDILAIHLKGVEMDGDAESFRLVVASFTQGFSGADLANLVNEAVLLAAREGVYKIRLEDMVNAFERVKFGVVSGQEVGFIRNLRKSWVKWGVDRLVSSVGSEKSIPGASDNLKTGPL